MVGIKHQNIKNPTKPLFQHDLLQTFKARTPLMMCFCKTVKLQNSAGNQQEITQLNSVCAASKWVTGAQFLTKTIIGQVTVATHFVTICIPLGLHAGRNPPAVWHKN